MSIMRAKPPCYGCTRRAEACHASCEAYTEWSSRRCALRREAWEKSKGEWLADGRVIDSMIRLRKRKER